MPHTDTLLTLLGEIGGLLELDELRQGLLDALLLAVPSDWASLNDMSPDPESVAFLVEPMPLDDQRDVFLRYAHENPLVARFQRTLDGRAYRFSDVVTRDELHALTLYREFYAPLGIEHQIAFVVHTEPDAFLAVALSRCDRDYSDAERDLLNRARPFIIQAHRNARLHSRVVRRLADRAIPQATLASLLAAGGLTAREADVVSHVALGRDSDTIAAALGVSRRTVHKHLENSYRKLGVASRSEAAGVAWRLFDAQSPG